MAARQLPPGGGADPRDSRRPAARLLPPAAETGSGPFAGYPRVFGLAWAFVAHTDSHFDPAALRRFIAAYQSVQPLTIGELWAVAITLRIVLIENLRRLADQITEGRRARTDAQALANRLLAAGRGRSALDIDIASRAEGPLSELFAAQLAKRLRDQDPRTTPALGWLEDRLRLQGTSMDEVVEHSQQRQGASNVTVRNVITSMRLISDIDWAELFESVSLVDERLRAGSAFAAMDFATRNLYRSAIEQLARGSALSELDIATRALRGLRRGRGRSSGRGAGRARGDPGYHLIADGRRAFERAIGFTPPLRLAITRFNMAMGIGGYVGAILLVATALAGARPAGRVAFRRGCRLARAAGRIGAGRLHSRDRGGGGAGQPHDDLELRRDRIARPGAARRRPARPAHAGGRADAADQPCRIAGAHRTAGSAPPFRRRRRSVLRPARGRARCRPGGHGRRRRLAGRRRRGHRAAERALRPGARRRAALLPAAPAPRLQRRRGQVDGLGAQTRQAARAQPAAARRDRHDVHARPAGPGAGADRRALRHHAGCGYPAAARRGAAPDRQDGPSPEPAALRAGRCSAWWAATPSCSRG